MYTESMGHGNMGLYYDQYQATQYLKIRRDGASSVRYNFTVINGQVSSLNEEIKFTESEDLKFLFYDFVHEKIV